MTNEPNELREAFALLRETKPHWLGKMAPDSPIDYPPIGERQAKFDMGFRPIALDGDSGSGGSAESLPTQEALVIVGGVFYEATIPMILGDEA